MIRKSLCSRRPASFGSAGVSEAEPPPKRRFKKDISPPLPVSFSCPGLAVQERTQLARTAWMLQLAQCLGFDLADTFTGNRELLADFFQRVVGVHANAETHAQNTFFTRRQRSQNTGRRIEQIGLNGGIDWQKRVLVLDEIAQM